MDQDSLESSENEDQKGEYVVEKILDKKFYEDQEFYLIKWRGYPDEENTWEPKSNCTKCTKMIQEFEQNINFLTSKVSEGKKIKVKMAFNKSKSGPKLQSGKSKITSLSTPLSASLSSTALPSFSSSFSSSKFSFKSSLQSPTSISSDPSINYSDSSGSFLDTPYKSLTMSSSPSSKNSFFESFLDLSQEKSSALSNQDGSFKDKDYKTINKRDNIIKLKRKCTEINDILNENEERMKKVETLKFLVDSIHPKDYASAREVIHNKGPLIDDNKCNDDIKIKKAGDLDVNLPLILTKSKASNHVNIKPATTLPKADHHQLRGVKKTSQINLFKTDYTQRNDKCKDETKFGFENGLELDEILGATKIADCLAFYVKYKNTSKCIKELIPSKICNKKWPKEVIRFYQSRLIKIENVIDVTIDGKRLKSVSK